MSRLSKYKDINAKKFLLIGVPNVGKSTIFNLLTSSTTMVSNVDRMTTEHSIGKIKKTKDYLIDLPGIYNLSHPIAEEKETHYHLLHHDVNAIVNVVSAFSIQRDLFLTIQCIETGLLNTLCINMVDLINTNALDWEKIGKKLNNVKIILTRSNRKKNIDRIVDSIYYNKKVNPNIVTYSNEIEQWIAKYSRILPELNISKRFASIMFLENNLYFIDFFRKNYSKYWPKINYLLTKTKAMDFYHKIRQAKFKFINQILADAKYDNKNYLRTNINLQNRFDHFFLKKWIGIPVFILITILIYYLAFGTYAGGWIQQGFSQALTNKDWGLVYWINKLFVNVPIWINSMFVDGILGGLFIIIAFIPPIFILHICIAIIQQTGLLSRVSILLDNALSRFGISGRSIINLLTAFGCNVPAIMLSRSSSSKKEQIISILMIPFIPCATKILVISSLCSIVFGQMYSWIFILLAIVLSGSIALILGLIFSKKLFRRTKTFFCIEMVNWNGVDVLIMLKSVWQVIKSFLKKAILTITLANLLIWLLLHIGTNGYITDGNLENSLLYWMAKILSYPMWPIFGQLNWKLTASLIAGLPAKEAIYSTLIQVSLCENGIKTIFNYNLSISFMIFVLYYIPCFPSIKMMLDEIHWKKTIASICINFTIAYFLALSSYWIGYCICK